MKWDVHLIPDLTDKVAIETGGNIGLGFQSAPELSRKGASVIIACRAISKGEIVIKEIKKKIGESAKLEVFQYGFSYKIEKHEK